MTLKLYLWNLFQPNITKPSNASLQFLSAFLSLHKLPSDKFVASAGCRVVEQNGETSLRSRLLYWMMPVNETEDDAVISSLSNDVDRSLLSHIFVTLALRDTRTNISDIFNESDNECLFRSDYFTSNRSSMSVETFLSAIHKISHLSVFKDSISISEKNKIHGDHRDDCAIFYATCLMPDVARESINLLSRDLKSFTLYVGTEVRFIHYEK